MNTPVIFPVAMGLSLCALLNLSVAAPSIGVAVDKSQYTLGETLQFSVSGENPDADRAVDVHIGFIAPDGQIYELPDWNTDFQPWLSDFTLPGGFSYPLQAVMTVEPATLGMSAGEWSAAAALLEPGTLEIISLATQPFSLTQASTLKAIPDTGQSACYDANIAISCPAAGADFYGQDGNYSSHPPSYVANGDGTVSDALTGLTWQQSPDTNGDGSIDASDKLSYSAAQSYCEALNLGNRDDWRLPDIKELYSLIDFRGTDPSGVIGDDSSGLTPFIDTAYFAFGYGDSSAGERLIDAQFASNTRYVSTTMNGDETLFGVNFADGRIKGYGLSLRGVDKTFYVLCARGDSYGANQWQDNGDGTISDGNSGLMWAQQDSGTGMDWQTALAWVAQKNAENYLGYSDWRLPNAKELQSLVDYSRSPDTTQSAAIDPLFSATAITNEGGQTDYPFYWSGTTHLTFNGMAANAVYVAFGRALGYMNGSWLDVHGAGAQRSDPKAGDAADYPTGHGPQGDAIRIENYVRLVRG